MMNEYVTVNRRVHSVNEVQPDEHEDSRQGIISCPVPTATHHRTQSAWASSALRFIEFLLIRQARRKYESPSIEQVVKVDRMLHFVQHRPLNFLR